MTARKVVVDKSTVPVGTADKVRAAMQEVLAERGVEVPFSVASNPEFLKEGAAINDFMSPDRIIVGTDDEHTIDTMRRIYAPFQRTHERVMVMDVRSAELTKYAANAMLATRISFMNEMANLAEALGADIEQVRRGIGADPRIGYHFLYPGIGYGGSCFPKDVQALMRSAGEHALPMRVIEAAETANQAQKLRLAHKVVARYGADLQGRTFALWGLAFKPNTDDMREAPSLSTIADLTRRGARIRVYDPVAMPQAAKVLDDNPAVELVDDMYQALDGADGLLIATEWKVFRAPDLTRVKQLLKAPLIIDGRNLYVPADMRAQGFDYQGIGRA
ncbi:UDP-glucose 6-dehydrogenase [Bordetella pertussis]|nr:UDP-glucose 6-dehydrogenase [Bordetella pertussis]CPO15240.1 UDP-glucose 6-dehydrogenase [Bordetella pertussis]